MSVSAVSSSTSTQSDNKIYDKRDANKDGTVSAQEEIQYEQKHPEQVKKDELKSNESKDPRGMVGTLVDTQA
ncbi:MAG: hypothetical protein LLG06_17900 [Desulfobacteraceae bacterium]|nr:hypothetical protein [Desulfobacteraceae bacterium]